MVIDIKKKFNILIKNNIKKKIIFKNKIIKIFIKKYLFNIYLISKLFILKIKIYFICLICFLLY